MARQQVGVIKLSLYQQQGNKQEEILLLSS
jgi:hypothetical protein